MPLAEISVTTKLRRLGQRCPSPRYPLQWGQVAMRSDRPLSASRYTSERRRRGRFCGRLSRPLRPYRGRPRRRDEQRHPQQGHGDRKHLCDGERPQHTHVHAHELQREAERAAADEVARQQGAIREPWAPPANQQPREEAEEDRLEDLRRVHTFERGRQSAREGHAPGKRRGVPVVVADQEAADAPQHLADGQGRRRGGEPRDEPPPLGANRRVAGDQAAGESAEPAHTAAIEEQGEEGRLGEVLEHVQQLGAEQPADESVDGGVERRVGQPRARQLAAEHPQSHECAERDPRAETGDVEGPDAEEDRQQAVLDYFFLPPPLPFLAARLRLALARRLLTVAAAIRLAVLALRPWLFADFLIFSYIRLFFAPFTPRGGMCVPPTEGGEQNPCCDEGMRWGSV